MGESKKSAAKPPVFHLELQLQTYEGDSSPFEGIPFKITYRGNTIDGTTDGTGTGKADLPGNVRTAMLRLDGGKRAWKIPIEGWPMPPPVASGTGGASPEPFPTGTVQPNP